MSVELIKKSLVLNQDTRKESVQVIKEKDLIVPDGKPDMQKIIKVDSKVDIEQIDVQQDRIFYKGKMDFAVLYVPENNPSAICTMKGSLPLEDFIIMEGTNKDHSVKLSYNTQHLHWSILNERKLNIKVIIQLEANTTENGAAEIVTDCDSTSLIQTKKKDISFCKKGNRKEDKMVIKDELALPSGKPNIGEVLKIDTKLSDEEFKRTDEEIYYSGNLNIATLYKAQNDEESIETMYHQIPFSSAIEYIREDEEQFYDCQLDIIGQYAQIIPDLDGEDRIIEIEITIKIDAENICSINEEIIEDIYCPGKDVKVIDETKEFINLLHKTNTCTPKKESITFEETAPDNEAIYSVCMKPVVEEKSISNGRLGISGIIEVEVMYLTTESGQKVASTHAIIPFSQEIEVTGINKDSIPSIASKVSDIRLLTQGKRELAVEFKLCHQVEVYGKESLYIMQDVELLDKDPEEIKKIPSMIIYTVKPGDSYWSIAKKYNTTLKDMVELNEIDPNEELHIGQKIMILKRTNL